VPTRLLAIGDIHLGRLSGRLPGAVDPASVSPAAALRRAVRAALEHEVDALLLAGDVADSTRDHFHALGTLSEVLEPLRDAGIPVIAVAGNHDHEVLPRLASRLPNLQLLGAGGRWETAEVDGAGGRVRVLGWSFPERQHPASPARGLPRLEDGMPTIGLLHADLGAVRSAYAPVTTGELQSAGEVRWLLGHIHRPSLDPADDAPGYLGSLQGLDPTETGPRGPWLIQVDGGRMALRHLALAPLRWEQRDVDVAAIAEPVAELPGLAMEALQACEAELTAAEDAAAVVGVRLRLTGRAADPAALAVAAADLAQQDEVLTRGPRQLFVDTIELAIEPALDLDTLARRDDPPGLLARMLLEVRDGGGADMLAAATRALQGADRGTNVQRLGIATHEADAVRGRLLQCGYQVLGELLAARGDGLGAA
jgi:DNA repair exonuclease SbcCD nuclease subunit